ncbi:exodeoxyribonuclease VII small subunit [Tepidibacillus fermentans]|uniref:Exodeoxyribonuclease 7 small subunit n=1 Tax=Tepidibacillus fermentans TaxID=1281767 RepID=A0A4R3KKN1_9BACI|nr:exodeoxyribonuclease VII small subunit [Tepidibacillus fermentans]TCS84040.1 exodeoxyribonuclease VII small subunit [Tepidibacillus fermentans]
MGHELLTDEQIEALTFEEALERLEKIVDQLESGNVPLEFAIDLFQEGMKLAKRCHLKLDNIEQKIEVLLEKDGEFLKKPFDQDEVE